MLWMPDYTTYGIYLMAKELGPSLPHGICDVLGIEGEVDRQDPYLSEAHLPVRRAGK